MELQVDCNGNLHWHDALQSHVGGSREINSDHDQKSVDAKFNVQAEAQKQKMDVAATKHANKIPGNAEPNAGGVNREAGDRKARTNDRKTNGGE